MERAYEITIENKDRKVERIGARIENIDLDDESGYTSSATFLGITENLADTLPWRSDSISIIWRYRDTAMLRCEPSQTIITIKKATQ